MKPEKHFLSIMIALLSLLFTQAVSATYMKYTHKTPIMTAYDEYSRDQDGYLSSDDFFWNAKEQFNIEFIIPELVYDLDQMEEREAFYKLYENPVVSITAANLFNTITINSSNFAFETWMEDGYVTENWWLWLEITDNNFPNNVERRASIWIDASGSYMTFYQDNYYHRRCAGQYPPEWEMGCWSGIYNSVVDFGGEYTGPILDEYPGGLRQLFGERIPVPEPLSSMLLLTGLAGIFLTRRIKFKNR